MKFNVNDRVRIRLNGRGYEAWRKHLADNDTPYCLPTEVNGWSEWQLHEVMMIFGPHISPHAAGMPFHSEMELVR